MRKLLDKKSTYIKVLILLSLVFASISSYAFQDCNDPLNPNPDLPDCDPFLYVPIDDGVYFILAAGILIGYTLLRKNKTVNVG